MNTSRTLLLLVAPLLLTACSSTKTIKVAVPPRVDLQPYPVVGMVAFASNANEDLERMATQRFLREVQAAQPGTRVVELGSEADVLASVGARSLNAKALRAIGEHHGVDALVIGRLDVEKSKPQINLSSMFKASAKSEVNAELSARLIETGNGATAWTDSTTVTTTVASAGLSRRGGHFGSRDAEDAYGELVDHLVVAVTDDFRETYVLRKVRKDEIHVADVRD